MTRIIAGVCCRDQMKDSCLSVRPYFRGGGTHTHRSSAVDHTHTPLSALTFRFITTCVIVLTQRRKSSGSVRPFLC